MRSSRIIILKTLANKRFGNLTLLIFARSINIKIILPMYLLLKGVSKMSGLLAIVIGPINYILQSILQLVVRKVGCYKHSSDAHQCRDAPSPRL